MNDNVETILNAYFDFSPNLNSRSPKRFVEDFGNSRMEIQDPEVYGWYQVTSAVDELQEISQDIYDPDLSKLDWKQKSFVCLNSIWKKMDSESDCDSAPISPEGLFSIGVRVGRALFGDPENEIKINIDDLSQDIISNRIELNEILDFLEEEVFQVMYQEEKGKIINNILKTMLAQNKEDGVLYYEFVFIYICSTNCDYPEPIIKIPSTSPKVADIFIDSKCRVYKGWNNFLKNNDIVKCNYAYPRNGKHSKKVTGELEVEFGISPNSKVKQKVLKVLDVGNTVCSAVTGTVGVASLFIPLLTPITVASLAFSAVSGSYGIGRSIGSLIDKGRHNQSISLADRKARGEWLSIVGNSVGIAAGIGGTVLRAAVGNGRAVGFIGRAAVNTLNIAALGANGVCIGNSAYNVIENLVMKDEISPLEVFQLTSSILFWTNSIVNMKTASAIIKETQVSFMKNYENNLNKRQMEMFKRTLRESGWEEGNMNRNSKIIRGLRNIKNPNEFFYSLEKMQNDFTERGIKMVLSQSGTILMDNNEINPSDFYELSMFDRAEISRSRTNFSQGIIDKKDHIKNMRQIMNRSISNFDFERRRMSDVVNGFIDVAQLGKHLFGRILENFEIKDFTSLIAKFSDIFNFSFVLMQSQFPEQTKNLTFLKITCNTVGNIILILNEVYLESRLLAEEVQGYDRTSFDADYGILGNRMTTFCSVIWNSFFMIKENSKSLIEILKLWQQHLHNQKNLNCDCEPDLKYKFSLHEPFLGITDIELDVEEMLNSKRENFIKKYTRNDNKYISTLNALKFASRTSKISKNLQEKCSVIVKELTGINTETNNLDINEDDNCISITDNINNFIVYLREFEHNVEASVINLS